MATLAASPSRPGSALASYDHVVLPPLPETQTARPPTAPGRRAPEDDASRRVPDDYFMLPRIETATRVAEDPNPYQPPQAAVSTRVPGSKLPKSGEGVEGSHGAGGVRSPEREARSLKDHGGAAAPDLGMSRSSALDTSLDSRAAEQSESAQRSGAGETAKADDGAQTRIGSVPQEKKAARRGPLPSQARKEKEKESFAARLAGGTGGHKGGLQGEFSTVGKADAVVGRDENGEVIVTDEGHSVVPQTETPEQRLERIRMSNVRKNYGAKGGGGDPSDPLAGLSKKDQDEARSLNPSSPRRARQAEHEFGYKAPFCEEGPEMMNEKAKRRGQQLAAPYGKNMGASHGVQPLEASEVKTQIRATQLRFVEKAAPDLEEKPPPALSVESGDAAKNKDVLNTAEMSNGSDETCTRVDSAGRVWVGLDEKRAPVARIPHHGSDGGSDNTEFRLQPATAHGVDVGFERTLAYSGKRQQGVQLDEKDMGLDNYQTPSGGYVPSNPNRTKHMGSDGTRAQARAEVAVAAPIKLPRQEGFAVDRDKDAGVEENRLAAARLTAPREQSITRKDEIAEESRLAHKQSGVLSGPGKLEDTDYDELDLRPSELALKIKEKRGAYAVPKDQGQNEERDARPIPQELQLKPPVFLRQKGSGEDKMRSAYY